MGKNRDETLDHPNIVKMYGVCYWKSQIALILEMVKPTLCFRLVSFEIIFSPSFSDGPGRPEELPEEPHAPVRQLQPIPSGTSPNGAGQNCHSGFSSSFKHLSFRLVLAKNYLKK